MTRPAGIDRARLMRVALDVRHPLAWLAVHPTIELAASMSLDVDWLPLDVPPLNPPSQPAADDDRGVRHRRFRAEAIAREIDVYARAQRLTLREPYRRGEWEAGRRGWLFVRDRAPDRLVDYLLGLFRGYWSLGLDVSDGAQIAALVARSGADAEDFATWQRGAGASMSEAITRELGGLGIFQAPAFMLGDEVFYGRQHLPMLRWILEDRRGPAPI